MKVAESGGGCLPSERQLLFIRACILDPAQAVAAWDDWQSHETLDTLDEALYRLLPHLYYNLKLAGYNGEDMLRLKGLYRRSWYHNQLLFHTTRGVLAKLQTASIPAMLLKGVALSHLYYPDPNIRAMSDADIMVRRTDAHAALSLLQENGWTPRLPITRDYAETFHAVQLDGERGQQLDVHWRLFHECPDDPDDELFWRDAVPMAIGPQQALTLCTTDHLLHTCIHGYIWNPLHSLRWIVDAHWILKKGEPIDWNRMIALASRRHMSLRLQRSLEFIREHCGMPVPEAVIASLRAAPVDRFDRYEHDVCTMLSSPPSRFTQVVIQPLRLLWCKQRRFYPQHSVLRRLIGFPAMLSREMRLHGVPQLLAAMPRYLLRKRKRLLGSVWEKMKRMGGQRGKRAQP